MSPQQPRRESSGVSSVNGTSLEKSHCIRRSPSPRPTSWVPHTTSYSSPTQKDSVPKVEHNTDSGERKIEKCINNKVNSSDCSSNKTGENSPGSTAVCKPKPKIWSLADTATSQSPSSGRRSPQSFTSPRDMSRPYPAQPLPAHTRASAAGFNGLRTWLNGTYMAHPAGIPHPYLLAAQEGARVPGIPTIGVDARGMPVSSSYGLTLVPSTSGLTATTSPSMPNGHLQHHRQICKYPIHSSVIIILYIL